MRGEATDIRRIGVAGAAVALVIRELVILRERVIRVNTVPQSEATDIGRIAIAGAAVAAEKIGRN